MPTRLLGYVISMGTTSRRLPLSCVPNVRRSAHTKGERIMSTTWLVQTRRPVPDHDCLTVTECQTSAEAIDLADSLRAHGNKPLIFVRRETDTPGQWTLTAIDD